MDTNHDAAAGVAGIVFIVLFVLGVLVVNLIPSAIAIMRGHPSALAIVALNLLLGCTGIGWVVALVWALSSTAGPEVNVIVEDRPRRRRPRDGDDD